MPRIKESRADKISFMFKFMDYDSITDDQHNLVVSFEEQFEERGYLSDKQYEVLSSIFKEACNG